MILAALAFTVILQQKQNPPIQLPPESQQRQGVQLPPTPPAKVVQDVGVQSQAQLIITKHLDAQFNPGRVPVNGTWTGGMQQQDIQEGLMSFSLANSSYQGKPCKLFQGQSKWDYHPNIRNKKIVFTPNLYVFAQISPDGQLLHSNTSYSGFGTPVQIDAVYHKDSIDITKSEGTNVTQTTLYPNIDMALFNDLFDPLVKDGIVTSKGRQIAFLHPITGAPVTCTVSLHGRFVGQLYFRQYEGYNFDTTTPDGSVVITSLVSRQGELLQVNLPNNQDALAYSDVTREEEDQWGKFKAGDWDMPSSKAQPGRRLHSTFALPVLLTNPCDLLLPLPYAVALQ